MVHKHYNTFTSLRYVLFLLTFLCLFKIYKAQITIADTHIQTNRNAYRSSICNFYSANYSSSEISKSQEYINQYSYLSTKDIEAMIISKDFTQIKTQTLLIVIPHIIAYIVVIILWIPLCCCCAWPEKHPSCNNCRKPEKEMYGKVQLKWSAYCAIVFYLVVMAGAIMGAAHGTDIVYSFNDIGCRLTSIGDDILNGRLSPTVANRFFVGITPLATDLASFSSSFNTIWTQNQNSLNSAGSVRVNQNAFQVAVNATYSSYTGSVYSNAFSSDGTNTGYTDINSIFKTSYYGPTTASSTILGNIYSVTQFIFNQINNVLDPMISAWANLTTTTQSTVTGQMNTTLTSINTLQSNVNSFINAFGPLFNKSQSFNQIIMSIQAFYGMFLAFALLGLLASIILACYSVVKVRLIMYLTCSFMLFLSFISFALLIIVATMAPNLSQICSYIDTKFASGNTTTTFFSDIGAGQLGNFLSNCMLDGNGWIMDKIEPSFNQSFANLLLISQNVQLFNDKIPNYSTSNLNAPFTAGNYTINQILNARILDVNDTIALNFMAGVRLVSFALDPVCNSVNVNGDSWIPSLQVASCPGGKAQNTPCLTLSNTTTCPLGCYQIMNQMQSASGDSLYTTTLAARYGSNTCNYYKYIVNLQNNWNVIRKANMNGVLTALTSLGTSISAYDTNFKNAQANITTYATILQSNFGTTTNLTAGTFNGLDCRVIGQTVIDFRNSLCVGFLNSTYYSLMCLILISYGSLMVACCATCAGVRHFKHLQRMQIHVGYKGVPVSISQKKLNDM